MSSLSDGRNFGARDTANQSYYAANLSGPGRWITVPKIGTLWTNDVDSLQWADSVDSQPEQLFAACKALHQLAAAGVPASEAFDAIAADYRETPIVGNLRQIAADY